MIVVADTGPLHYLVSTEAADALPSLYGGVLVPQAVAQELHATDTPAAVRAWIAHPPQWCEVRPDPPSDPSLQFLHMGERAATALALVVDADRLLIDEQVGRAVAKRRHVPVTGTLGILGEAHRVGILDFESALATLRRTNFYSSEGLVDHVRRSLFAEEGQL